MEIWDSRRTDRSFAVQSLLGDYEGSPRVQVDESLMFVLFCLPLNDAFSLKRGIFWGCV
jgi:hypothetical protein